MHARVVLLGLAGLSLFAPRAALASAPEPPSSSISLRSADVPPPAGTVPPPIKPSLGSDPALTAAAISPPRYDLLWSNVLDSAVTSARQRRERSADSLSAILQPGPLDALIPVHPDPWIASGTPRPVPTGVQMGMARAQPVAIINPVPLGAEISGQLEVVPSVVLQMPWMIP